MPQQKHLIKQQSSNPMEMQVKVGIKVHSAIKNCIYFFKLKVSEMRNTKVQNNIMTINVKVIQIIHSTIKYQVVLRED